MGWVVGARRTRLDVLVAAGCAATALTGWAMGAWPSNHPRLEYYGPSGLEGSLPGARADAPIVLSGMPMCLSVDGTARITAVTPVGGHGPGRLEVTGWAVRPGDALTAIPPGARPGTLTAAGFTPTDVAVSARCQAPDELAVQLRPSRDGWGCFAALEVDYTTGSGNGGVLRVPVTVGLRAPEPPDTTAACETQR